MQRFSNRFGMWFCLSLLLLHFQIVGVCSKAWGTAYFVDSRQGADQNDGLSADTAWRTLDRVNSSIYRPGDHIFFKRGEKWLGTLKISSSGKLASPITVGAYGEGPPPLITGLVPLRAWETVRNEGFIAHIPSHRFYGLFRKGKRIKQASSEQLIDGDWYFDPSLSCVFLARGLRRELKNLSYSAVRAGIALKGVRHVCIRDLHIANTGSGILATSGAHHLEVKRCILSNIYERAIAFHNTGGACKVEQNVIRNCGDGIYFMGTPGDNNIIQGNSISYCNYNELNNNDGHAIGIQNSSNNLILRNRISYCRNPIALWARRGQKLENNTIAYNTISDCKRRFLKPWMGKAIAILGRSGKMVRSNKIYYNIIKRCNIGVKLRGVAGPGNCIYNNVVSDCVVGIHLSKITTSIQIKNNIIFRSSRYHIRCDSKIFCEGGSIDYNVYFPNGPLFLFNGREPKIFSAWVAVTGCDVNSVARDPGFLNTESFELAKDSFCIDRGVNVGIRTDIAGRTVPLGFGVDIGVREFAPGVN